MKERIPSLSGRNRARTMSAGWPLVQLRELAQVIRGVTYKKADAREAPAPGYTPMLRTTNIQDAELNVYSDLVFVPDAVVSAEQHLRGGDIVVATSSGSKHLVGKAAPVRSAWRGSFGAFCAVVRPLVHVCPMFLAYFLQSPAYKNHITTRALGVNINNLRRGDLEGLPVPFPPPEEQTRIVAEIEKQFSRLDEAVANLKRVKANLKRYRASVLKAAVEGRLVPTEAELARREGRSYETGDQLLARILEERRAVWEKQSRNGGKKKYVDPQPPDTSALPELPEGWVWVTFGQVAERITKGSSPNWQGFEYCERGIPFVRSQNVGWGETDLTDLAFLPPGFNEVEKKAVLKEGDLLLNIVGASIGRAAVAPRSVAGGNVNQAVALIRLTEGGARNHFVLTNLLSAYC